MDKIKLYLCGAMEHAPDKGKTWRTEIAKWLTNHGFEAMNPLDDDISLFEAYGLDANDFESARLPENMFKFRQTMNNIVKTDIRSVEESDGLIVYFDEYLKLGAGSYGEMTLASYLDKSIYLVLAPNMTMNDVSGWIIGCNPLTFKDFPALKKFLTTMQDKIEEVLAMEAQYE